VKDKSFDRRSGVGDEWIAAYVQGLLSPAEKDRIENLMARDARLREDVRAVMDIQRLQDEEGFVPLPEGLSRTAQTLVEQGLRPGVLFVIAVVARGVLRMVKTTGQILVGPQILPEHVLRAGGKGASHTSVFQKKFGDLLVRGELSVGEHNRSTVGVTLNPGQAWPASKHFRVTLWDEEGELEDKDCAGESVMFEGMAPGKYKIVIAENNLPQAGIDLWLESSS